MIVNIKEEIYAVSMGVRPWCFMLKIQNSENYSLFTLQRHPGSGAQDLWAPTMSA